MYNKFQEHLQKELAEIQSLKRQNNTAKAIAEGIINYLSGK